MTEALEPKGPKKRKIEVKLDPVFDEFLKNENERRELNRQLKYVMKKGVGGSNLALLHIVDCNARSEVSFSCAAVTTTPIPWEDTGPEPEGIAFGEIFQKGINVLDAFLNKKSPLVPRDVNQRNALQKLLKFLLNDHQILFEKQDRKSNWSVLVAQHMLSPLAVDGTYTVSAAPSSQEEGTLLKCPCSERDDLFGKVGDTSFGVRVGWHGSPDIIMEEDLPVSVVPCDAFGDSSADQTFDETDTVSSSDYRSVSSVEIKDRMDFLNKDVMQLIAETIVFSFLQRKLKKDLLKNTLSKNTLIPGIAISGRTLLLTFYDCVNDVLISSRALPLFDHNTLDVGSVLALWLTLNYRLFCTGVTERMKNKKSDFFKRVDDFLPVYSDQVEKPVHLQHKKEGDLFPWLKRTKSYEHLPVDEETDFLPLNSDSTRGRGDTLGL